MWELPLAFFRVDYYIVHVETGGVLTMPPGDEETSLPEGYERVTKNELFERWPVWRQEEERLLKELGDTGSAPRSRPVGLSNERGLRLRHR
jgi:hypothetical protein